MDSISPKRRLILTIWNSAPDPKAPYRLDCDGCLLIDLGHADFGTNPDPSTIFIDDPRICTNKVDAVPGHVYLQRVLDPRGNDHWVVFQIVATDKDNRFIGFLWRRLPGGVIITKKNRGKV